MPDSGDFPGAGRDPSMKPGHLSRELDGADLGDRRLDRRLVRVAERMAAFPSASLCAACGGWDEAVAAYRLLGSEEVTPAKILAPHREALLARAAQAPCVALIQDTTELDFSRMKHMEGCGPLSHEERRGLLLHTSYAVSETGLPPGVWSAEFLARKDTDFRGTAARKKLPVEEKESRRWVEGYAEAVALARRLPQCEVFSLSDREGDIYEVYAAAAAASAEGKPAAQWIIRACQDRALEKSAPKDPERLFAALAEAPLLGEINFEVPASLRRVRVAGKRAWQMRSARKVCQEIRARPVQLRPPWRKKGRPPVVTVWAVWAAEKNPPPDEEPVSWMLLTGTAVPDFAAAQRLVALYRRRWDIEVFHRTLKTGCRVESLQLKGAQAVRNAVTIYLITAWRILYLTHIGRLHPKLPCSVVFAAEEWLAACAVARGKAMAAPRAPPREPALGEFIIMVARLGGYLGRKHDGPPGAQTLWQGLARLRDFVCTWRALHGLG
jgi:hypothetical protein